MGLVFMVVWFVCRIKFYLKTCVISGKMINYEDKASLWKITGFFSQKQHLCQREHAKRYPREQCLLAGVAGDCFSRWRSLLRTHAVANDETRVIACEAISLSVRHRKRSVAISLSG